jgi:uncharacterized protein (TIGR02001 family)
VTWSLALTSDYVFRGITQTDYDPALQAGLTYSWDNGIYVGGWTSNVDFADSNGPDIEFDTYIGWSHDLQRGLELDSFRGALRLLRRAQRPTAASTTPK